MLPIYLARVNNVQCCLLLLNQFAVLAHKYILETLFFFSEILIPHVKFWMKYLCNQETSVIKKSRKYCSEFLLWIRYFRIKKKYRKCIHYTYALMMQIIITISEMFLFPLKYMNIEIQKYMKFMTYRLTMNHNVCMWKIQLIIHFNVSLKGIS